jgi:hypothetical protein
MVCDIVVATSWLRNRGCDITVSAVARLTMTQAHGIQAHSDSDSQSSLIPRDGAGTPKRWTRFRAARYAPLGWTLHLLGRSQRARRPVPPEAGFHDGRRWPGADEADRRLKASNDSGRNSGAGGPTRRVHAGAIVRWIANFVGSGFIGGGVIGFGIGGFGIGNGFRHAGTDQGGGRHSEASGDWLSHGRDSIHPATRRRHQHKRPQQHWSSRQWLGRQGSGRQWSRRAQSQWI